MAAKYLEVMLTEAVCRAQNSYYGSAGRIIGAPPRDLLGQQETEFIAARDSFYMGTVSETGWPYIQHRGGPSGFLRVLNPSTLAFPDYQGNRQLISTGHLLANDRVALFLMDYRNRDRLKLLGHARVEDVRGNRDLLKHVTEGPGWDKAERIVIIDVVSYDWNCPKYITPRFLIEEVEDLVRPLKQRITDLESALRAMREQQV
ncbi:MAG: hypothetical protein RL042_484 [Nitrospirota bacterium]|jgi:predicted pyridoxine 5'-phosphate oxidase superfamily flavin-nucleotide-binding protein